LTFDRCRCDFCAGGCILGHQGLVLKRKVLSNLALWTQREANFLEEICEIARPRIYTAEFTASNCERHLAYSFSLREKSYTSPSHCLRLLETSAFAGGIHCWSQELNPANAKPIGCATVDAINKQELRGLSEIDRKSEVFQLTNGVRSKMMRASATLTTHKLQLMMSLLTKHHMAQPQATLSYSA
jgi:hypothetical protein